MPAQSAFTRTVVRPDHLYHLADKKRPNSDQGCSMKNQEASLELAKKADKLSRIAQDREEQEYSFQIENLLEDPEQAKKAILKHFLFETIANEKLHLVKFKNMPEDCRAGAETFLKEVLGFSLQDEMKSFSHKKYLFSLGRDFADWGKGAPLDDTKNPKESSVDQQTSFKALSQEKVRSNEPNEPVNIPQEIKVSQASFSSKEFSLKLDFYLETLRHQVGAKAFRGNRGAQMARLVGTIYKKLQEGGQSHLMAWDGSEVVNEETMQQGIIKMLSNRQGFDLSVVKRTLPARLAFKVSHLKQQIIDIGFLLVLLREIESLLDGSSLKELPGRLKQTSRENKLLHLLCEERLDKPKRLYHHFSFPVDTKSLFRPSTNN